MDKFLCSKINSLESNSYGVLTNQFHSDLVSREISDNSARGNSGSLFSVASAVSADVVRG